LRELLERFTDDATQADRASCPPDLAAFLVQSKGIVVAKLPPREPFMLRVSTWSAAADAIVELNKRRWLLRLSLCAWKCLLQNVGRAKMAANRRYLGRSLRLHFFELWASASKEQNRQHVKITAGKGRRMHAARLSFIAWQQVKILAGWKQALHWEALKNVGLQVFHCWSQVRKLLAQGRSKARLLGQGREVLEMKTNFQAWRLLSLLNSHLQDRKALQERLSLQRRCFLDWPGRNVEH